MLKYFSLDRWALVLALLLITCLAACDAGPGKTPFNAVDITGADYASDFVLTDPAGKQRALADFKGKVVVLFFGVYPLPGRLSNDHGGFG